MAQEPEYIYPPNTLKSKVTVDGSKIDAVALKQAEMAIEDMQDDYLGWVKDDLANLTSSYEKAKSSPENWEEIQEDLYGFAHDVKGQGSSFGYPLVTAVANQLCVFMEGIEGKLSEVQLDAVKVHIDTMKLVVTQKMAGEGGPAGEQLLKGLDAVIAKVTGKA
jgi:chemotaxis protein histidine kinase CheA